MLSNSEIIAIAQKHATSPDQKATTIRGDQDIIEFARAVVIAQLEKMIEQVREASK